MDKELEEYVQNPSTLGGDTGYFDLGRRAAQNPSITEGNNPGRTLVLAGEWLLGFRHQRALTKSPTDSNI
jgi:hypothetical protein